MAKVFAFSPSFSFGFLAIGQMPGRWKLSLRPLDSKTAGTFQAGDGTDPQCRTGLDERPQGASGFTFPSEKKKKKTKKIWSCDNPKWHTYKYLMIRRQKVFCIQLRLASFTTFQFSSPTLLKSWRHSSCIKIGKPLKWHSKMCTHGSSWLMTGGIRFHLQHKSLPLLVQRRCFPRSQPGAELNPGALRMATRRNLPSIPGWIGKGAKSQSIAFNSSLSRDV